MIDFNGFVSKFAEQLEIEDSNSLTADTLFRDLEEWSSLSILELVVLYDDEFNKQIGDSDIANCKTLADLYELVTE